MTTISRNCGTKTSLNNIFFTAVLARLIRVCPQIDIKRISEKSSIDPNLKQKFYYFSSKYRLSTFEILSHENRDSSKNFKFFKLKKTSRSFFRCETSAFYHYFMGFCRIEVKLRQKLPDGTHKLEVLHFSILKFGTENAGSK